jgi:GTPase SAR1 family protein
MLVGLGEAGKTSLLNALRKENNTEELQVTDGISIKDWEIILQDNSKLTFSMWDFG